ncbi:MAG TPA: glycosyltransferase family 4 protein, partial [Devosiaceae bacterium]|nr:glycosyltransferase family 4 protein [Devosiaceae bacterium]
LSGWMTTQRIALACAEDRTDDWARSLRNPVPSPSVVELVISAPFSLPEMQSAQLSPTNALLATFGALRDSSFRPADPARKWIWRQPYLPNRSRYFELLRQQAGTKAILPRLRKPDGKLQVGMLLPVASFGGVEKVAYAISRVLVAAGCDVHLFVLGKPVLERHRDNDGLFASINFLAADYPIWGGPHTYAGHELQMEIDGKAMAPDLLGLLNGLDLIVNNQCASVNAVLGSLRRRGAKVVNYVHVLDRTAHGRDAGHPYLALAFEHVYDAILTCSQDMVGWLRSMGVPAAKLHHVVNAPSYEMPEAEVARVLAARRAEPAERPLRALFLGRFDAQKGIERLHGVVRELQRRNVPVEWRIVGRDVLDAGAGVSWQAKFREIGTTVLPPLYTASELTRAFGWADVVVLPSRWEGAPLTILEAQRLGCVPLSTDVGAVGELITDGADGLLVAPGSEGAIVEAFVAQLARLAAERGELGRLSVGAAQRAGQLNWSRSAEPLLELMQEWFPNRLALPRLRRPRVIRIQSQAAAGKTEAV